MPIVVVALRVRRLALAAAVEADRGPARKTSAPNGGPPPRREATARVPTDPCSRAWMRVRTVISFNPNLAHTECAQPGGRRRAAMTGPPRSAAGNNGAYVEFAQRPCTRGHGDDRVLASATHGDLVQRLIATRPGAGDCRAYSGGRATTLYAAHGVAGCGSAGPIGTGPCRLIATRPECGRSPRVRGGARNDPIRGTRRGRVRQCPVHWHRAVPVDRHPSGCGRSPRVRWGSRNDPIRGTWRGRVRECRAHWHPAESVDRHPSRCGRSPHVRRGSRNDPIRGTRRGRVRQCRAHRPRAVSVDRHPSGLGDCGAYAGGARNDPIRGTRRDRMRQGRADRHRAVAVDRHQFGLGDRGAYAGAARNDPIRGTRRGRVRQCRGPSAPGSPG